MTVVFLYLFALWCYTNYLGYREIGVALAIQGRYLLPILPILIGYVFMSVNTAFSNKSIKLAMVLIALLLFTQGGGISTLIIRSEDSWYWQRSYITEPNSKIKELLKPFIKEN